MEVEVYIDESGDTGWSFNKPNGQGGSSRYLTIAYVIVPSNKASSLSRLVRKIYEFFKLNIKVEKKGASFRSDDAKVISKKIVSLLNDGSIKIGAAVVDKQNVPLRIQEDKTVIYNYALVKVVSPEIDGYSKATIIPDKRTVKVVNGDTLDNYFRIHLHAELLSDTILHYEPRISEKEHNLWFIDWIANFIWRSYENGDMEAFDILREHIKTEELFFTE